MKIKVKAAAGVPVHFPMNVKTAPGARTFVLAGETVVEVDDTHRFIRRRLKVGDLVLVKNEKQAKPPKKDQ